MIKKRTDIHRPSAINPGDYGLTGNVFDLKYDDLETMEVGTKPYGHCNHCGKAIRWAVEFRHFPTGTVVVFGEICANILGLSDDRTKHELVLLKRRVANLEKKMRHKEERDKNYRFFKLNQPEVVEYLENLYDADNNYFLKSLKWNLEKYGMLTTAQVEAFGRVMEQREEAAEAKRNEVVPTTPVTEGRQEIEGEVFTVKWQDSFYGTTQKMGVKLADGNKVYGTVPACIDEVKRGDKVRFTATVEKSDKDEHFGYYKKPTKASIAQ
jgi:hypothetical protein